MSVRGPTNTGQGGKAVAVSAVRHRSFVGVARKRAGQSQRSPHLPRKANCAGLAGAVNGVGGRTLSHFGGRALSHFGGYAGVLENIGRYVRWNRLVPTVFDVSFGALLSLSFQGAAALRSVALASLSLSSTKPSSCQPASCPALR